MATIPQYGFGTYQLKGDIAYKSVLFALSVGYTHIDTAPLYRNEKEIGRAISDSKIDRKNLFLTTKVLTKDQYKGKDAILKTFEKSLKNLRTDYIDLLLLHVPCPKVMDQSWKTLEYLYTNKKCLMIGVSNFDVEHMEMIYQNDKTKIYPMVNQIELSPFLNRTKLVEYLTSKKIIIEAHSSLTRKHKLNHQIICDLAKKYDLTPALILIKWAIYNNYIVLPRSQDSEHIKENISKQDIRILDDDIQILNELEEGFTIFPNRKIE